MYREMTMVVGALAHGYAMKTGAFPREGEVKTMFDSAELILKEAMAREPKWRALEAAHEEVMRKIRETEGRR